MIVNINPQVDEKNTKYFLAIYHDVGLKLDEITNQVIKTFSPGHFYIGLRNGIKDKSYGLNPSYEENSIISGQGIVKNEDERLFLDDLYERQTKEKVLCSKFIPLTYKQYCLAAEYVERCMDREQSYIIGIRDCTDFVQEVYHETGLSLYFTKVFTKQELIDLGTEARFKVMSRYGARDCFPEMFINMEGESIEAISNKLNIPCAQIVDTTNNVSFIIFHDSLAITKRYFSVFLNEQDYKLPSEIAPLRNALDAAEQADFIRHFILSDTQAFEAQDDLTGFFDNMVNSYSQSASNYVLPSHILFPEIDDETRDDIEQLVAQSTRMFEDLDLDKRVVSNNFAPSGTRVEIIDEDEVRLIEINDELGLD